MQLGTAAHVVEPMLPGARDSYINLGRFYDAGRLEKRSGELNELSSRYKSAYTEAYRYLAAAGRIKSGRRPSLDESELASAVKKCASLLPASAPYFSRSRSYFIDAVSCKGNIFVDDSFSDMRVYSIASSEHDANAVFRALGSKLEKNGYGVVYCPSPLDPSLICHIIIPSLNAAFTTREGGEYEQINVFKGSVETQEEIYIQLIEKATEKLALAKKSHDALEEVYNPCVDFSGIYAEAEKHINAVL